jgi:hypothetical protein
MAGSAMAACGAASIYLRSGAGFLRIPIVESTKKWQKTYVKNVDPAVDRINLPPFCNTVPAMKHHWGYDPRKTNLEVLRVMARLQSLVDSEHLVAMDFLATFVSRRVLPL